MAMVMLVLQSWNKQHTQHPIIGSSTKLFSASPEGPMYLQSVPAFKKSSRWSWSTSICIGLFQQIFSVISWIIHAVLLFILIYIHLWCSLIVLSLIIIFDYTEMVLPCWLPASPAREYFFFIIWEHFWRTWYTGKNTFWEITVIVGLKNSDLVPTRNNWMSSRENKPTRMTNNKEK